MGAKRTESVERALGILNAFSAQRPSMSLAEIADETGLHKSTILRLTTSMAIYGFIHRDKDGRFSPGASVWRLGLVFRQQYIPRDQVAPALKKLVAATGETASIYIRSGKERVCLYRENSPNLLRFHAEEGMRLNLSTGSSGAVLRRFSGEDVEDLSVFNENGTATCLGQTVPEIYSISAPVFTASGELFGALTVSGLGSRFDKKARDAAIPLLESLAKSILN